MARISLTYNRKFRRLARAMGSPALALGTLELLWLTAYENADPVVGGAVDVADATNWPDSPDDLVRLLAGFGFIDQVAPDLYAVHDLWDHAPEYVRLRWKRAHPGIPAEQRPWRSDSCVGDLPTSCREIPDLPAPPRPAPPRNEGQRASARDPDPPNPRVLTRLAYDLPSDLDDEADKKEALKTECVRYGLTFDGTSIGTALDAVARTRKGST